MRTLRVSLIGTVMLALLAGLGSAVVAQDESDGQALVTYVTGRLIDTVWDDTELTTEGDVNYGRGWKATQTYEWSDPRLPAVKQTIYNFNSYPGGGTARGIMGLTTTRLEDSSGAWTGGARTMQYTDGHGVGWDVYIGEGAYDGLIAVLECNSEGCEGQIFEGEMPPMPDPIEPPAE